MGRMSVRIRVFTLVVALLLGTAGVRAVQLQGFDSQAYAAKAAEKMQSTKELPATRGDITDRFGVVMATTEPAMLVSIDPMIIRTNGADERYPMSKRKQAEAAAAPEAVADLLVKHLGGKKETYLALIADADSEKTGKQSRYAVVARRVSANTFTELQADLKLGFDGDGKRPWYGVYGTSDPVRAYPNRTVASNVIGFVNAEGEGASGLEYALDDELTGTPGKQVYDASTYGRIPLGTSIMEPAVDGVSYQTTIDSDLQWMAEQALAQGMTNAGASTGKLIVMNVNTGEVLALANGPSFDSADTSKAAADDLGNRAVTEAYEPGSVQKVLTMAALADQGLVTPDTEVVVPPSIASGGGSVRDSFSHGTIQLTARGIIAKSSNIGTIELARQLDKAELNKYLSSFGLGAKTGIGLPGESSGQLPGPDMADYTRDQIAFGQGLSVNAVQMAAAVAAVVNGGTYHQPTILKSATRADGTEVELPTPVSRRVISEEASSSVVEMMESVVTLSEKRAIDGYRSIGKSGTAQRFDPECKCYNGYTSSYVGVAPAEDPQILVYVVLDEPTNGNLGSQLALPVVNDVLRLALPRYNVAPSTTEAPDLPLTFE
ncbi:cell division protein FtsI (penicillin-binding protein 3) [Tessaracoccus bendigoensis DSM 12906]|uniref:Cell division protein FtsI (Penicillin-binding protein 3) n=1 Tax=Tessaracoccus bendigoensis DSM 12906 TaxID=1123357 RepID=A0A1M6ARB5_9ACTN|nr:penicillin-binding protein 2 [Tessaracoccus bendigoensis]SHI38743.1 cell division protein FtsI (penicillin-binding protein 3) [Tessaracoccus bendigoensis DSM 12906]